MRIRANGGIIGPQSNRGNFTSTGDSGLLTSITNVYICDSNYNDLDDTVMSTSGGYIRLTGVGFSSDCSLYVNGVYISFTQIISSNEITAVIPANGNGTYSLTLFNSSGSGAIWAAGLTFSGFPSWTTGTYSNSSAVVSTQLLVTGDGTLTYSLQDGSTLPDGVTLSSSGLLSGTVTGITTSTVYTFTVLVDDAQLQTTQQLITLSVVLSDQYFNSTVLLLHGNGTDGSNNNNTFKDSSTNNFTITRTGTPTQGTFSPFSQTGWSGYFNGTPDYVTVPSNAAFEMGAGDYTVECWFYATGAADGGLVMKGLYTAGNWQPGFGIRRNSDTRLYFYFNTNTTNAAEVRYTYIGTVSTNNAWHHIAMSVQSGIGYAFLDGVLLNTGGTTVGTIGTSTTPITIGSFPYSAGYIGFLGYISNVRIVKGTAVYTSSFTPSTTPLTAVSGTSLLTLQDNRFKDNSSNNFTITATGTPSVQAISPFAPAAAYSTATGGGSGYFNGTPDCLSVATNTAFDCGTGNWTIEAWVYAPAQTTTAPAIISNKVAAYGAGAIKLVYSNSTANAFAFSAYDVTSLAPIFQSSVLNTSNTWQHVAVVRNGTALTMYRNGVSVATTTISAGITFNFGNNGFGMGGGNWDGANSYYTGYISNARVLKGTALYTTAFTPPTAPLTAVANTSLLLNATNAAIFDQTAKNDLVTVGTSAVSNTQSKFGGKSMFFNGTTDYLTANNTPNLQLGTGNFTIEAWVYLTTASTTRGLVSKGPVAGTTGWECKFNSANFFRFEWTASSLVGVTTIPITTWTHVAVVRSGSATGNVKLYVNGTLYATSAVAVTDNFTQTDPLRIGIDRVGTGFFPGYVDDLRITKYARYTANFTPPTSTFLDQ